MTCCTKLENVLITLRSQLHQKEQMLKSPVKYYPMLMHVNAVLDASTKSKEHGKHKTLHIIYASVPVGLCCPFIFICVFWSLRRYYGEQFYNIIFPYCVYDSIVIVSFKA